MFNKKILIPFLALALVSMACSININLPSIRTVKTGPTQTEDIQVPVPETSRTASLTLSFGAGTLDITSGAGSDLVTGTATYNVADLKPDVTVNNNQVRIEQGNLKGNTIPNLGNNVKNEWDLKLGDTEMDLRINAGAYSANYELGGLALTDLEISDGAADVSLSFNEPNQAEMDAFRYTTGASNVDLEGLANANFTDMYFRSGAGSYTLDFSGDLKRDANISIDSGVSTVKVIVPEGVNARLSFDGSLSNVSTNGSWSKSNGDYVMNGSGPTLTFVVKMGAGTLELSN